ncbi:hypothetical protein AB0395_39590 [Streptosporangium sp. NPDC051023]|uniref:hypothetical protein n=1 Tax=Streptosporangium sp. NPDC051023 TaxID=3155410 RepID=UPI003450DB35
MATRRNLCLNPALDVDTTGWGGGSTPTRVTVSGFDRTNAAEYTTSGSYCSTAATATNAVTVGATYTLSAYARANVFNVNSGALYVEWINAGGGGFGYPSAGFTLTANTVTRLSITATAPSGAVACRLILDSINFSINPADFTMVLIEESAALGTYFDGNTANAVWDGTAGLSSSTLTEGPTAVSSSDTATGADAATLAAASSATDTSVGAEAASLAASLPAADTAAAVETTGLTASATTADTGTGADTATLSVSTTVTDTATAADVVSLAVATSTADTAVSSDTATLTATTATADAATAVETALVGLSAADTAAIADSAFLAAASTAADLATAAEFATVTVTVATADTGTATENAHALIPGQDITIRLGPTRRGWAARSSRR